MKNVIIEYKDHTDHTGHVYETPAYPRDVATKVAEQLELMGCYGFKFRPTNQPASCDTFVYKEWIEEEAKKVA